MICKIADLGVEIPEIGDLMERCSNYLCNTKVDILLDEKQILKKTWEELTPSENIYLNSGTQFYYQLLDYSGMMLHASCVVLDGYAYLFSGPCGVGKSTHTQKYLQTFDGAKIINDDKPALRKIDGVWYVYGTPWCGKDGININLKAKLGGICFLHRGDTKMKLLTPLEATVQILPQCVGRGGLQTGKKLVSLLQELVQDIPLFEFYNHANDGDEQLTYVTMKEERTKRNL